MNAESFCEHFATFAEAPNGVAKLRELILQLAVQGKLGTQDVNDEPAVTMFDVEDSRIDPRSPVRRQSLQVAVREQDIPFRLPQSWTWTTLSAVATLENGDRSKNYPNKTALVDDGIPFINAGHLKDGRIDMTEMNYITEERFQILHSGKIRPNDILFCLRGSLGKCGTVETLAKGAIASSLVIVRPSPNIDPDFMLKYLASPLSTAMIRRFDNGTAQPNLSAADLRKFLVALPPLAEQRRIVAKVDQLLELCDELAARQAARREARERLVGATLDRLVSARSAAEFPTRAHRLRDHFDRLFDTPTTLPQLRQAILQLAVQGQLVPQDPNDEPASVSLAKLSEQGGNSKVRRSVPDEVTRPANLDVERIPESWAIESTASLLRVGAIVDLKDGNHGANHPKAAEFTETGLPFITAAQVSDEGLIDYDGAYKLSGQPLARLRVGFAKVDDVIYTHKGSVGRVAICQRDCVLSPQTTYYRVNATVLDNCYLRIYLMSPAFRSQVDEVKGQTTRDFVSIKTQYNFFIRVPPLSEQKRIVSKVTELLSLCDALEAKLTQAESTSTQLLSAAVAHLLANSLEPTN